MYGMRLLSYGAITMKNIDASGNGFFGAQVANDCEECTDGVTLASTRKGWNTFSNNNGGGLQIDTNGKVIISDVSADNNSLLTGVFFSGGLGTASVGEYYNDALGADVWAFYATAGIPLTIQLDSKWSPSGEVFDPYLELYDDESFLVASDDNSGGVLDAEISFLPTEDGWYYLHASGQFEVDGYYWLAINDPTFADITEMDCDGLSVNTISSVAMKSYAVNTFNNNSRRGLDVLAESHISVQRVNAESNGTDGVSLVNIGESGNVSVYGQKSSVFSIFNNNKQDGLTIFTNGKVTLRNLWTEYNGLRGIRAGSSGSPAGGTVYLQNIYALDNGLGGLEAFTTGLIKVSKVHTLGNGTDGMVLDNTFGEKPVSIKGDIFSSENGGKGISIKSNSNITASKITAANNGETGLLFDTLLGRITLSRMMVTNNGGDGFDITGNDKITLSKVHSTSNGIGIDGDGIHITASATTIMTFKYSSFMTNEGSGIEIVGTLIPPTLSKTYYFGNDTNGSGDSNLEMSL